jgi:hypothetical protein
MLDRDIRRSKERIRSIGVNRTSLSILPFNQVKKLKKKDLLKLICNHRDTIGLLERTLINLTAELNFLKRKDRSVAKGKYSK